MIDLEIRMYEKFRRLLHGASSTSSTDGDAADVRSDSEGLLAANLKRDTVQQWAAALLLVQCRYTYGDKRPGVCVSG